MGVLVCRKHQILLQNSSVMTIERYPEYICADDIELSNQYIYEDSFIEYNLKYLELVKELINHGEKRLELIEINNYYKYKLIQRGLISVNGKVNKKKLLVEFKEFFPKGYLKLVDSDYEINNEFNWLSRFFEAEIN